MSRADELNGVLAAVERVAKKGGDADDVLRKVVALIGPLFDSVAIAFVEDGDLVVGPNHGLEPDPGAVTAMRIAFDGNKVAELQVSPLGDDDEMFLAQVSLLVAPFCLVGWDTGGVPWDEL